MSVCVTVRFPDGAMQLVWVERIPLQGEAWTVNGVEYEVRDLEHPDDMPRVLLARKAPRPDARFLLSDLDPLGETA